MVHIVHYWAHGGPCVCDPALCIFLPFFRSGLLGAGIETVLDESGARVLLVPS